MQRLARVLYTDQALFGIVEEDKLFFLDGDPFGRFEIRRDFVLLEKTKLLPPVQPGKIICVGHNYVDHIKEMGRTLPDEPRIFLKAPSAIIAPNEAIVLPPASHRVEHEGELAVVMGKRTRDVPEKEALRHALGMACFNDVTARDLQKTDGVNGRAKSFDTFAPLGPWIRIIDETDPDGDISRWTLETKLNGDIRQHASLAQMIFSVPFLISFVSRIMTLFPGDIIATGTPAGTTAMKAGDTVEVTLSGVGTLSNPVIAPNSAIL